MTLFAPALIGSDSLASALRPTQVRAEPAYEALGLPISRSTPSRMKGMACFRLKSVPQTGEILSWDVVIRKTDDLGDEQTQWNLWHELAHALDYTTMHPERGRIAYSAFGYGRLSSSMGLLYRHEEFLAALTPMDLAIRHKGQTFANDAEIAASGLEARMVSHLRAQLAKLRGKQSRYKRCLSELFAEAVACYAMRSELLKERAPDLWDSVRSVLEKEHVSL